MRPMLPLALILIACPGRRIPEHLRPPDPAAVAQKPSIDSVGEAVAAWVGNDPLARSTSGLATSDLMGVGESEPFIALLEAASALDARSPGALQAVGALEGRHRGTAIVPLARGSRLRVAEGYAGGEVSLAVQGQVLGLITPLPPPRDAGSLPLGPMEWAKSDRGFRHAVLTIGDRWVLAGWLDGPGIDVEPASDALNAPPFDALRTTPLAQVVLARSAGLEGDTAAGLADLRRAARLVLRTSAADTTRDKERIAAERSSLKQELGTEEDPVAVLLDRATRRLTDAAGSDLGAGGALMSIEARRRYGRCPNTPCGGLDRVDGIAAAGRWDGSLQRLSRLWTVAALKDGLDGLEVARGTVRYPAAVVDLVDALVGAGATPPDSIVLLQRSPDSATWLALARSVGAEQATTWEEARSALARFSREYAERTREAEPDPEARVALDVVIARLAP